LRVAASARAAAVICHCGCIGSIGPGSGSSGIS
jgi:hypothetical protein